jgi:putative ABC transport system substrate-binding protein
MHRREFMLLLSGAVASPRTAAAQPTKMPRIGILVLGNPDPAPFLREFREGLRALGYIEGENVVFEFRSAKGSTGLLATLAQELVALKVDMIVGFQTPTVTAARQATTEIPIVMAPVGDPIGTGLVASLALPGGNVTGVAGLAHELGGKNLELMRDVLPGARKIAVLANVNDPFHKPFLQHIETAGRTLALEIKPMLVRGEQGHADAFAEIAKAKLDAVILQPSLINNRTAEMALERRLPSFSPHSAFPRMGGLLSYSADQPALFREAATFVDKILKGRKPADLPVQLPTKFLLIVNLKTAKALGLTIPPTLLVRADQVIE